MKNTAHSTHRKSGIYMITNTVNGKCYIGSSKDIYYRVRRHLADLRSGRERDKNPKFRNGFKKYGEDAFYTTIIEECPVDNLVKREEYWINKVNPWYNVLTICQGRPILDAASRQRMSLLTLKAIEEGRVTCGKKKYDVFNLQGDKVYTFNSQRELCKALSIHNSSVLRMVKGKHAQCKGWIVRYADTIDNVNYRPRSYDKSMICKKVNVENTITGEISVFESLKAVKTKFSKSVVYNVKTGVLYQGYLKIYYAT